MVLASIGWTAKAGRTRSVSKVSWKARILRGTPLSRFQGSQEIASTLVLLIPTRWSVAIKFLPS